MFWILSSGAMRPQRPAAGLSGGDARQAGGPRSVIRRADGQVPSEAFPDERTRFGTSGMAADGKASQSGRSSASDDRRRETGGWARTGGDKAPSREKAAGMTPSGGSWTDGSDKVRLTLRPTRVPSCARTRSKADGSTGDACPVNGSAVVQGFVRWSASTHGLHEGMGRANEEGEMLGIRVGDRHLVAAPPGL
ncbi:hypothetical protein FKP32DRAFT_1604357 [Trametes sanguinea]|nr:hypothetical protein FKP32DRAFT_1604357 [Trametes sanguinea]